MIRLQQGQMMGSEAIDALSASLSIKVPCIIFRNSCLEFSLHSEDLKFLIDLNKSLELISISKRLSLLSQNPPYAPDAITFIPRDLKVSMAGHWENRVVPKDTAFLQDTSEKAAAPVFDSGSDWTFTTLYKGHFEGNVRTEETTQGIPVERLGPDNPILWGGEVVFYEDELDDCGHCKFGVRVRAMGDCFFALLRLYLRVDHVVVRILDTRIFHSYEERSLIREFQARESSYDELRAAGFNISPQWSIDPRQSDLVYQYLNVVHCFKEKIYY